MVNFETLYLRAKEISWIGQLGEIFDGSLIENVGQEILQIYVRVAHPYIWVI